MVVLCAQVASLTKDVEDLSQYTQQYQEKVTHKVSNNHQLAIVQPQITT